MRRWMNRKRIRTAGRFLQQNPLLRRMDNDSEKTDLDFHKILLYIFILFVLYAMQTTAGAFSFFGIRPIWVLPFAVAISMCEDVVSAAVFGSLSGLLCDLGSQALFGFNGLLVLCGCVTISLLSFFSD